VLADRGGEAPARPRNFDEAAGLLKPKRPATPIRWPSRGISCGLGEARCAEKIQVSAAVPGASDAADPRLGARIGPAEP
jgi:hypothetical protein